MINQSSKIDVCISADVVLPVNYLSESRPVKIALNDSPVDIKRGDVVQCLVIDSAAIVDQIQRGGVVVYKRGDRHE